MKQFNWKYYFVLLLFLPVLLEIFLKAENYITFLWTFALLMVYFVWILFSGIIFYKYNKKRGLRNEFCINYEYEMLAVHFWIDTVNKELAVLCLLNPLMGKNQCRCYIFRQGMFNQYGLCKLLSGIHTKF